MKVPDSNLNSDERRLARELREMELASPSTSLKDRIREAAEESPSAEKSQPLHQVLIAVPAFVRQNWFGSVAACVALLFAVLLTLQRSGSDAGVGSPIVKAETSKVTSGDLEGGLVIWGQDNVPVINQESFVSTNQQLISQRNLGIVETEDGQSMWKIEYELMNRATWQDPQKGEQERLVPEKRVVFISVHHD